MCVYICIYTPTIYFIYIRCEMLHKNMYSNLFSKGIYITYLHLECTNGLTTFTIKSISI